VQLKNINRTVAAPWVFAIAATAFLGDFTSSSSWVALAGCTIVPPLVMMSYWKHSAHTMSQSIQQALR
jgi:hypothetical protein